MARILRQSRTPPRRTATCRLLIAAVAALGVAGCATAPPQPRLASQVTTESGRIQTLRYNVFGYASLFSATVEEAADAIAQASDDPTVRRNALLWKMNALPAGLTAMVHPDPLANLLDVWALTAQMDQYFSAGAGSQLFDDQQPTAVEASRQLTTAAVRIAREFMPADLVEKATATIETWATAHPLKTPLFARNSALELVAPLMVNEGGSIPSTIGGLDDRMDSLTARLTVYGTVIPKLVRWQAELMLLGVPDTLIQVEDGVFQSVQVERTALTDAIDHERLEAFDQIANQRTAFMKDLEALSARTIRDAMSVIQPQIERGGAATIAAIDALRVQTLRELRDALGAVDRGRIETLIRGERVAAMKDAEQIATATVDHAFSRLYRLLAVIYLATFVGAALLILLWKKLA